MDRSDRFTFATARPALAAAVIGATMLASLTPATALPKGSAPELASLVLNVDHRRDRHRIIGAGIVGLAAGALLGGALAAPRYAPPPAYYAPRGYPYYQPYYAAPPVVRYVAPPVVHYAPAPVGMPWAGGYPPFSDGWLAYCSRRYRSFDPRTGTFLGYDGNRHYCR